MLENQRFRFPQILQRAVAGGFPPGAAFNLPRGQSGVSAPTPHSSAINSTSHPGAQTDGFAAESFQMCKSAAAQGQTTVRGGSGWNSSAHSPFRCGPWRHDSANHFHGMRHQRFEAHSGQAGSRHVRTQGGPVRRQNPFRRAAQPKVESAPGRAARGTQLFRGMVLMTTASKVPAKLCSNAVSGAARLRSAAAAVPARARRQWSHLPAQCLPPVPPNAPLPFRTHFPAPIVRWRGIAGQALPRSVLRSRQATQAAKSNPNSTPAACFCTGSLMRPRQKTSVPGGAACLRW